MGDDPYDFEIALPAAPTSADRFTRSQRRSSDSDENISDVSGSLSNMSGISSDNDSERGSDRERKQRTESSFKRATKSAIEPKTAASSSALDRAKNFLSKYSSATTGKSNGSKAPASLRVGLDLDDDDEFSMESSSGDEKEDIGDSDPPQISKQQIIATQANERQEAVILQNDNEDGSQNIRAYQLDEGIRVKMKDASTQFTGNHAAIQTDLVPDGMHNLFVSPTPTPTFSCSFSRENEVPPSEAKYVSCHSKQQPPPPPPISPQLGASAYSLDALKLPTVASTSLYKQQLLNLQEQILQKKRETERIVHDRMTFQYSSLRGIERFIADRRVQKLELWEALMRVDPTLDERKAREAARGDDVKH
ncbi:hypothetical protein PRIC2_010179 [Phytophthora ramorum]